MITCLISLNAFATDTMRGRHWGEIETIEKEEKPKAIEKDKYTMPTLPSHKEMMKMHPKEIEVIFDQVQDMHVMNPTLKSAKTVLFVKDVINKKSRAAGALETLAGLKNPELTGKIEYSITPSAKALQDKDRFDTIDNRLIKDTKNFAVIIFTQKSCAPCFVQKATMRNFVEKYGWNIREIDIHDNPKAALTFNVNRTPVTIIVSRKTKDWMPIANGAEPLTSIAFNAFQGIRYLNKEITASQWFTPEHQQNSMFDPEYSPTLEN